VSEATPEPAEPTICTATTKLGRRCKKQVITDGLCLFHSGVLGDPAERGRRGGLARSKQAAPEDTAVEIARIKREIPGLMWRRMERMLTDPSAGDTAAIRACTTILDRYEPLLRDEAASSARRVFAAEVAGVIHGARQAAERGDCAGVLAALDRAQLDGIEPTVIEFDTDPRAMLDGLVELGLIHRVKPAEQPSS
jgi:hypothetical protein